MDTTASTSRARGDELADGDQVYVTGRWQTLSALHVRPSGLIGATTDRGSELAMQPAALFDVTTRG